MLNPLFTSFKFPYVHFSATKLSGEKFPIFWKVVKHLERIGLKVSQMQIQIYKTLDL